MVGGRTWEGLKIQKAVRKLKTSGKMDDRNILPNTRHSPNAGGLRERETQEKANLYRTGTWRSMYWGVGERTQNTYEKDYQASSTKEDTERRNEKKQRSS